MEPESLAPRDHRCTVDVLVLLDPAGEPDVRLDPAGVARVLDRHFPAVAWDVRVEEVDHPPEQRRDHRLAEVTTEARSRLLALDRDVVVVVTGHRVVLHGRRIRSHASPVQRAAVLSRASQSRRSGDTGATDLEAEVVGLIADLLDLEGDGRDAPERAGSVPGRLLAQVVASRPWLMTVHLSRTLVGASAAGVLAIVTPDFWLLADQLGVVRLALISVLVLLAGVVVLVVGGGLRERVVPGVPQPSVRLHNTAVWLSVGLGVLSLFAVLVLANLAITLIVLPDSLVAGAVGHGVGWATMTRIGVVTAIVSLVGSVFGAGLEEDEDVQDATFGGSDDVRFVQEGAPDVAPPGEDGSGRRAPGLGAVRKVTGTRGLDGHEHP